MTFVINTNTKEQKYFIPIRFTVKDISNKDILEQKYVFKTHTSTIHIC